jgi:hypothetical protein
MFNAFNHTNFTGFNNNLQFDAVELLSFDPLLDPPGTRRRNPNFGHATNGSFGTLNNAQAPREIQFGFKFTF